MAMDACLALHSSPDYRASTSNRSDDAQRAKRVPFYCAPADTRSDSIQCEVRAGLTGPDTSGARQAVAPP
eukprot:2573179-Heterocapsa_arctica.AAC.1